MYKLPSKSESTKETREKVSKLFFTYDNSSQSFAQKYVVLCWVAKSVDKAQVYVLHQELLQDKDHPFKSVVNDDKSIYGLQIAYSW